MYVLSNFFHLVLLCVLVLFFNCPSLFVESATQSLDTDKEALMFIRSQISLEPPNVLSSWDQNSSPCNWTGVVCNKLGRRVVGLNLSSSGLSGSISPYIGNLSFLQSLHLQNNQLSGTPPNQICNLLRLEVLNMSFNSLEGSIPSNVSKLVDLRVLDFMRNKITGKVPEGLSFLPKLQVLNLGRNNFFGEIPPSIANVSSLVNLNLGTNSLSGMIPSDLSRLKNLQLLDLTINNLTGTVPPSIYNMSSLVYLALASNQLWGKIPYDVGDTLPNLLGFNFCFNNFTGNIPGSLHNLTNIRIIRMAHNLLEGTVPPGLGNLPNIEMYNIGYNKIVSSGVNGLEFITSLANSTRLSFLALDGNLLEGVIPESVGNLSKALWKLYLGRNHISGSIPASIGHLSSLALLDLSHNTISGPIPREMGQLVSLQMLALAGNRISGIIPESLGDLQKLNQIDLSGNQLEGGIPTTFQNFHSLLSMDLSNNKLNGSIHGEILDLPSLSTILNLSHNSFVGPLPQEITLLESVVTIDLSDNSLSGTIPSSISYCKSLEKLYLAKNAFSGPIPATLGDIKGLETLDLSSNRLSGLIPLELQNLSGLRFLNLSYNDLEGAVPSGGVFMNSSEVLLEGNPKLCMNSACKNTRARSKLVKVCIFVGVMATLALCFSIASFHYTRRKKERIAEASDLIKRHQKVSYNELCRATGNFADDNRIGTGSFGTVYKGYLQDAIVVAIKVLDVKITGSWKSFLAECEALRYVKHRNLVKLITSCSSLDSKNMEFLALVYEFLGNGSLQDWLQGKRKKDNGDGLHLVDRVNVAVDVASALDYLHHDCEVPVVHCDLKPSNILLDEDMTAKVGDFGLAKLQMEKMGDNQLSISSTHALKGSIGYMPPEYGLGVKPTKAGDAYSFGVMLLELFTGKSPTDESFTGEANLIGWVQSAFPTNLPQVLDTALLTKEMQHDCVISILGLGLSCTACSPDARTNTRDALCKLIAIRSRLPNGTPIQNAS